MARYIGLRRSVNFEGRCSTSQEKKIVKIVIQRTSYRYINLSVSTGISFEIMVVIVKTQRAAFCLELESLHLPFDFIPVPREYNYPPPGILPMIQPSQLWALVAKHPSNLVVLAHPT